MISVHQSITNHVPADVMVGEGGGGLCASRYKLNTSRTVEATLAILAYHRSTFDFDGCSLQLRKHWGRGGLAAFCFVFTSIANGSDATQDH